MVQAPSSVSIHLSISEVYSSREFIRHILYGDRHKSVQRSPTSAGRQFRRLIKLMQVLWFLPKTSFQISLLRIASPLVRLCLVHCSLRDHCRRLFRRYFAPLLFPQGVRPTHLETFPRASRIRRWFSSYSSAIGNLLLQLVLRLSSFFTGLYRDLLFVEDGQVSVYNTKHWRTQYRLLTVNTKISHPF